MIGGVFVSLSLYNFGGSKKTSLSEAAGAVLAEGAFGGSLCGAGARGMRGDFGGGSFSIGRRPISFRGVPGGAGGFRGVGGTLGIHEVTINQSLL